MIFTFFALLLLWDWLIRGEWICWIPCYSLFGFFLLLLFILFDCFIFYCLVLHHRRDRLWFSSKKYYFDHIVRDAFRLHVFKRLCRNLWRDFGCFVHLIWFGLWFFRLLCCLRWLLCSLLHFLLLFCGYFGWLWLCLWWDRIW